MNTIDMIHNIVEHLYLADILYGAIGGKIKIDKILDRKIQLRMNSVTQLNFRPRK